MFKRGLFVIVCLLLVGVSVGAAQSNEPGDLCLQKGGNLDDQGQCVLSADVKIRIDYPLDLAQNDLVASTVDSFVQATKQDFLGVLDSGFNPGSSQYELDVNYESFQYGDNVHSLVFTIYEYTGGAHGISFYQTYTYDFGAGDLVMLDDLFQPNSDYLSVIDPLVEQALLDQIGDMSDPDWLKQGTGDNPENYQHFALDGDALVFYFDQYQVAAGAAGTQSVRIPLSELSDVLAPQYAP